MYTELICFAAGGILACIINIAVDVREIKRQIEEWGEEDDQL